MDIVCDEHSGYSVIKLSGRLDASNSQEADKILQEKLQNVHCVIIDMAKLSYISSAGLRILLLAAKRTQINGGRLVLCSLTENVMEVFTISGFTAIFKVCGDLDSAVEAIV